MSNKSWTVSLFRDQLICPYCSLKEDQDLLPVLDGEGKLVAFACLACGYKRETDKVTRAIYREGWKVGSEKRNAE